VAIIIALILLWLTPDDIIVPQSGTPWPLQANTNSFQQKGIQLLRQNVINVTENLKGIK
jgi:hypothetical protein